ncbi:MAG: HEAT repeat domain-containing protein [Gaiellaceae bacterium]
MVPTWLIFSATVVLFVLWLALAAWVVGARLSHDRLIRVRRRDARLLLDGADATRWSRRRLWRTADGEFLPGTAEAARELVSRDGARLRRAATGNGHDRSHALRVLTRGGSTFAFRLLRSALDSEQEEVRAAIVAIAAEQQTPAADDLLLKILVEGSHPRSRTATELAPRAPRLAADLMKLTDHPEPEVRYWALMLLREAPGKPGVKATAVRCSTDPSGTVRSAAARLLGATRATDVDRVLRALLADEIFFVRAHTARAVGEVGAEGLADEVATLLADTSWWVRAAAKESLFLLGDSGLEAATEMLQAADGFARDGAREVVSAFRRESQPLELVG